MNRYGIFRMFKIFTPIQPLKDQDRSRLEARIKETENRTGAQIVLSVIERCDDYPELPWKAFALGVALVSLILLAIDNLRHVWVSGTSILFSIIIILTVGAVFALLCVFVPGFARFFLDKDRSELETRQYAKSLFLTNELFATAKRSGILLLVGLFERQIIILSDTGLNGRLNQADLKSIIDQMRHKLTYGQIVEALESGLNGLGTALSGTQSQHPGDNELSDAIIEEEGR